MAAKEDALDSAIAYLDSIISRLRTLPSQLRKQKSVVKQPHASPSSKSSPSFTPSSKAIKHQGSKQQFSVLQTLAEYKGSEVPCNGSNDIEDFNKAQLQVGHVVSVDDHPVAEKLYICKVEVAKDKFRQVVAGLKKFLSPSELLGKKVCLVLNLKPAKLAGQLSEAMILAGEVTHEDGLLYVRVLQPPAAASVGDRIYLEGSLPSSKPAKQLSSKIWEKLLPLLSIQGGVAKFGHTSLVTSSGEVIGPDLPDGSSIH